MATSRRLDYARDNVGIDIEKGKLADGTEAEFEAIMDVNVNVNVNVESVWLCMNYELAVLVRPMGRVGQVEEIAVTVLYLYSDAAGITTGIGLPVT